MNNADKVRKAYEAGYLVDSTAPEERHDFGVWCDGWEAASQGRAELVEALKTARAEAIRIAGLGHKADFSFHAFMQMEAALAKYGS